MDDSTSLLHGHAADSKDGISSIFLMVTMTGTFLAMAAESFVLSTSTEIGSQFQQSFLGPWVLCSYNVGYCISLPMYGYLCRAYGHKRILLMAFATFALGSLLTGSAVSMQMLIASRFIAGIGGSGLVDVVSILINDLVPLSQVAVLRGYISLVSMMGICAGAPLGGLLMDIIGWRWSFAGQVPIILLCLLVTLVKCPTGSSSTSNSHKNAPQTLDVPGFCFLTASIGSLVVLTQVIQQYGMKGNPCAIALLVVFSLSTVLLGLTEICWSKEPLIPVSLMNKNGSWFICLLNISVFFAQFGLLANIANFYVRYRQISNSEAGLLLLPLALACAIGALGAGHIIGRTLKYKTLSIISLGVAIASYIITGLVWRHDASYMGLIPACLATLGVGSLISTQFVAISAGSPPEHASSIITTYYLSQQLGVILGVAVTASLSQTQLNNHLQSLLTGLPNAPQIIKIILNDNRAVMSLPEYVQGLVREAYLNSFQIIPILSVIGCVVAIPVVLLSREYPLTS